MCFILRAHKCTCVFWSRVGGGRGRRDSCACLGWFGGEGESGSGQGAPAGWGYFCCVGGGTAQMCASLSCLLTTRTSRKISLLRRSVNPVLRMLCTKGRNTLRRRQQEGRNRAPDSIDSSSNLTATSFTHPSFLNPIYKHYASYIPTAEQHHHQQQKPPRATTKKKNGKRQPSPPPTGTRISSSALSLPLSLSSHLILPLMMSASLTAADAAAVTSVLTLASTFIRLFR